MLPLSTYKLNFENSSTGEYLLSPTPEAIILAVNEKFLETISRRREDLIGISLFDAFPGNPDDNEDTGVAALRASLERVIETGKPDTLALQRYPIKVKNQAGEEKFEERYWSAVNTPIFDHIGKLICISHSTLDVTDLVIIKHASAEGEQARLEAGMLTRAQTIQQVNKALDEERCRLRNLFDRAPGFVYFTHGPRHVIEQVNDAFQELFGTRDVVGKEIGEAFPEMSGQEWIRLHDEVYRTGESHIEHALQVKLPGSSSMSISENYFDLVYQPIIDANRNVTGICGQGKDISEKKRIEDELRASEERFRALIEHTAQAVWETDAAGNVVMDSPSWRAYTGQTVEEWMGKGWLNAIHPDDMQYAMQKWQEAVTAHCPFDGEYRFRKYSGEWRWTNVRAAPIFNQDGTVRKWVGMNIDISDRKLAEERLFHSEEFHRITAEAANVGIWEFDVKNRQACTMSPLMAQMLGLPTDRTTFTLEEWQANIFPEDRSAVRTGLENLLENRRSAEVSLRVRWKNGSVRYLIARGKAIKNREGKIVRVFGASIDMTEQKKAQEELMIAYERLGLAISSTGDGLWDWDFENNTAYFSGRFKEILGYADHELPDHTATWPARIHPEDEAQVMGAYYDYMHGRIPAFTAEYRIECKNGEWKWVLSRGVLVRHETDGKPRRMIGMLTDISQRKAADEQVWRHANFDALTNLPNRRLFRDRLEQEIRKAQRNREAVALLFIDLDRFKQINDLLGHDAGDMLLIESARRIESCVRTSDTVARLGGDEFTVILPELDDTDKVESIAQNILDRLAESFQITKEVVYVSGSIGIALYPDDALTAEEMIRKADQAMYAAKHAGKNQFSYFTQLMDERAHQRIRLINELRSALHGGQLSIAYQPVVELASNRIVKAEALLRWTHPRLGNIEPSRFVPLAEESGLINEIGNWVFREAASCAKRWSGALGAPFQVGINKSPVQFLSKEEDTWISYLQSLGLSAQSIAVEITEGLLMQASSNVCNKLIEYRDAGIQVALDDFGVGYSSMSYLKKFDIDYLKIDQSFVQDMTENEQSRTIAESIIVMAHKLGLKVIAEGIETPEQYALLLSAGCDYGQGFLISHPVPALDFERKFILHDMQYMQIH